MLEKNTCVIICADSYPPVCYDPCADQRSQGPKRNHCDGSRDVYCEKPLPLLPEKNRCEKLGDCHNHEGVNRFSSTSTIQAAFISADIEVENDAVADASESDNDIKSDNHDTYNFNVDVDVDIRLGDTNNVKGNQKNDNDSVDVKDNVKDINNKSDGPKSDGKGSHDGKF